MLVLTRKQGEEIRIGEDIVLKVTAVQGSRVRIGIEAPREHRIVRPEAEAEKETASQPSAPLAGPKKSSGRRLEVVGA